MLEKNRKRKYRKKEKSKTFGSFLLVILLLFSSCTNNEIFPNETEYVVFVSSVATQSTDVSSTGEIDEEQTLTISYLNVGQGDCIFICLPNGETMLIDAGTASYGNHIVQYIKDSGNDTLNYVIITHPHADHIGGMSAVLKAFQIEQIYMPSVSTNTKTYQTLLQTIYEKNLTIQPAHAGMVLFEEENLRGELLAPMDTNPHNLNNASIVLRLSYYSYDFLFMGDAEQEVETQILAEHTNVSADIIKIGHHGSDTSSSVSFLKAVDPDVAVISVGEDNAYDHPSPNVLTRLQELQIDIWRTDEKGTIVVTCDKDHMEMDWEMSDKALAA
ncbi:MAG: MBL fold metallo-hydrolase [Clostridiales bacterium]|nr:MBL fold metallo-hydrolase [Clostridiales bacterium]